MGGLLANRKRMEAEIVFANYKDAAEQYIEGVSVIEADVMRYKYRVADALDAARNAGANVSKLTEHWMNIVQRVIEAKNKLHE